MEKIKVFKKPFQAILSEELIGDYEDIYCADDDVYRVYCEICDKPCIERYYKIIRIQELTQIISKKDKVQ